MRLLLSLSLAALLFAAGCSKDKDVEPPATLVKNFKATLPVKKLWGDGVGGGKKQIKLRLGLGPAIDNGLVFAANHKGEMLAVSLETGRDVWVKKLKLPISAGPAAALGIVVAGTSKGTVIALDGATGRQLWRAQINSELLSSPAISEKVIVIRSVDGRLNGLDTATGKVLWSVEQQVPRLSLRGIATPIVAKQAAISGFDNGKVMAVSLTTGDTLWDTALASPHGRTELDRLVDIDSAVTQSDGTVVAMRQRDGAELWRNEKLKRRGLGTPIVTGSAVAIADFQGYIHWLDKGTGELVARERISKQRVSSPPAGVGETIVVLTDGGTLAAYRATPKASRRPSPAAAPAEAPAAATPPASDAPATETPATETPATETPPPDAPAPPPATPPPAPPP